ncbi:MAG: hypothetical protein QXS49_02160, partial [Ferroplasma sp.]
GTEPVCGDFSLTKTFVMNEKMKLYYAFKKFFSFHCTGKYLYIGRIELRQQRNDVIYRYFQISYNR